MRTVKLIIAALILLAGVTALYVWMQPSNPSKPPSAAQRLAAVRATAQRPAPAGVGPGTEASATTEPTGVIHSGDSVWVKIPDEKIPNRIAWQFRADRYDPQPDNSMSVLHPQAEYFSTNGQKVTIEGTHGRVVMPGEAGKTASDLRNSVGPPSRGEMYDVTIRLYAPQRPKHPAFTCRVNNVAFDNDTFRIATEGFKKPDGTLIPADQVPVQVRGDEYDFDGRGLTIRWNDRDRRLESLEVAHGESFVVKNLNERLNGEPEPRPSTPAPAAPPRPAGPKKPSRAAAVPVEGDADSDTSADATATPGEGPTTRQAKPQPIYRATFEGGGGMVRVTQGPEQIACAEVMYIDLHLQDESDQALSSDSSTSAGPTTAPTSNASAQVKKTAAASSTRKPPLASTRKANSNDPAIVRWTGKLTLAPVEQPTPLTAKLQPGQYNIEMVSRSAEPVQLNYNGSEIRCASFVYGGGDDSLVVRSSPLVPVISMKDADGAILYTPSVDYDGTVGRAVLDGASSAEFPVHSDPDSPPDILKTKWSKSCVLTMTGKTREELTIQRAELSGDVEIDHPKLKLNSDTLLVAFGPSSDSDTSKSPQVKQLVATGSVKCDMQDPQQQRMQHITTDRLTVDTMKTETGELRPQVVTADGHVRAFDDQEQELRAGHLVATLAPTTRPTDPPHIERFIAQQDVQFKSKDSHGHADQLDAVASGVDDYLINLQGQPFAPATVTGGESTLTGAIIKIQPKKQIVQVLGPGTLDGVQRGNTPQAKPTRYQVAWGSGGMNFDGTENHAEMNNDVSITAFASDGSKNTATGEKLTMELMDDPKAATRPVSASTKPADPMLAGFDSMKAKTLRSMTLEGDTKVESILTDSQSGALLRRTNLFAPILTVDGETQQMTVPAAGRMLYQDLRATTRPTSAPSSEPAVATAAGTTGATTTATISPLGDMSGATAFRWDKQLNFDQKSMRAEMTGNVVIVHDDEKQKSEPYRLNAEKVSADFEREADKSDASSQKHDPSADGFMPLSSSSKVKQLTAEGDVRFVSKQVEFNAGMVTFDPAQELLTAHGTERVPVEVSKGLSIGSFQEVSWNTRTQQIKHIQGVQASIRR
ncbi:MAG TPA: hypothetical protein VH518_03860 [Tepidisphaeraceae bacterium]|jgi:hypothetical protein